MARKVNRNLAGAAAAAIAAVYAAGYAWTQPAHHAATAATAAAASPTVAAAAVTSTMPPDVPTAIARAIATATPAPATPTPAAATAAAAAFRDGTYSGTGTSRRGDVTVSLTIQNGQITAVKITRTTTYYPVADIARLPGQVVQRQSANVDFISGATDSSRAFRGAVTQALAQARAASAAMPAPATAAGRA